jgi:hypothetical protein
MDDDERGAVGRGEETASLGVRFDEHTIEVKAGLFLGDERQARQHITQGHDGPCGDFVRHRG